MAREIPAHAHARFRNEHGSIVSRIKQMEDMIEAAKTNPQAPAAFVDALKERLPFMQAHAEVLERQMRNFNVIPAKAFITKAPDEKSQGAPNEQSIEEPVAQSIPESIPSEPSSEA